MGEWVYDIYLLRIWASKNWASKNRNIQLFQQWFKYTDELILCILHIDLSSIVVSLINFHCGIKRPENRVITTDVKVYPTVTINFKCATTIVRLRRMSWRKTAAPHNHSQLRFLDKCCAIKELVGYITCMQIYPSHSMYSIHNSVNSFNNLFL